MTCPHKTKNKRKTFLLSRFIYSVKVREQSITRTHKQIRKTSLTKNKQNEAHVQKLIILKIESEREKKKRQGNFSSIEIDRYEHLDELCLHRRNRHLRTLLDVVDHDHYERIWSYENQSDEHLQHVHLLECRHEDGRVGWIQVPRENISQIQ